VLRRRRRKEPHQSQNNGDSHGETQRCHQGMQASFLEEHWVLISNRPMLFSIGLSAFSSILAPHPCRRHARISRFTLFLFFRAHYRSHSPDITKSPRQSFLQRPACVSAYTLSRVSSAGDNNMNIEAIVFYILLIDAISANLMVRFGSEW
jgi:hypothetical protein